MSQELDPHADSSQPTVYSSCSRGPRIITGRSRDRALAKTPDREHTMSEPSKKSRLPAAALVHPPVLGGAAGRLLGHPRPARPPDRDGRPPGHDAPADGRAPQRRGADGHPRLLRGRSRPGHHGHERLGRSPSPPGGSTCRRIPTSPSICPVGRAPSTDVRRTRTSGRACGPGGPPTTRISTPMRPVGPGRPRSSSCRPDPSRVVSGSRMSATWTRPVGPAQR